MISSTDIVIVKTGSAILYLHLREAALDEARKLPRRNVALPRELCLRYCEEVGKDEQFLQCESSVRVGPVVH